MRDTLPVHRNLPPVELVDRADVRTLLEQYSDLRTRAAAALRDLDRAQIARRTANERDAAALADAVRAGKKDPGPVEVKKAEAALAEAQRVADGLDIACARSFDELAQTVGSRRSEWLDDLDEKRDAAVATFLETLDSLQAAADEIARINGFANWVRAFPDGKGYLPRGTLVTTLEQRNGEPYTVADLFDHLRRIFAERSVPGFAGFLAEGPQIGRVQAPAGKSPLRKKFVSEDGSFGTSDGALFVPPDALAAVHEGDEA